MRDDYIDFLVRVHDEAVRRGANLAALGDRIVHETTPWDFDRDVRAALRASGKSSARYDAVDIGTGTGERLADHLRSLGGQLPRLVATEGWPENLPAAAAALAPWDVPVLAYDPEFDATAPLDDDSVALVIVRHDTINAEEFARVLIPGGRLVTEQIAGDDGLELRTWFGDEPLYPEVTFEAISRQLVTAGFRIDLAEEATVAQTVRDLPTLVEYLAAAPWEVADFDVREHADVLRSLADVRPLVISRRRFRITATKISRRRLPSRPPTT